MKAESNPSIIDMLGDEIEGAYALTGLDDAILGVSRRYGEDPVIAYDYDKIIQIYVDEYGFPHHEAVEWVEYNMIGGGIGDRTPVFVRTTT